MIGFAILLVFQTTAAQQMDPPPELRRDRLITTLPYAPIPIPEELRPLVIGYKACLMPGGVVRSEGGAKFEDAIRLRIKACEPTRQWAISNALAVYKPASSADTAPQQIASLLDQVEAVELRSARYLDDQIATQLSATSVTRTETFRIPDEFLSVVPYLNCLSFSAGTPVFSKGREIEPTVEKGGSCAEKREKAAKEADVRLRLKGVRNEDERRAQIESFLQKADAQLGSQRPTSFTMPPTIGKHVSPYLSCRIAGGACQHERAKAAADAEAALVAAGKLGVEERRALIATTLEQIDALTGNVTPPVNPVAN